MQIIASTIPVGYGGAGDYLKYIVKVHSDHFLLSPRLSKRLRVPKALQVLIYAIEVIAIKAILHLLISLRLIKSVVIHHPQSIGYLLCKRLIQHVEKIDYWVIDTSFFCKSSYNFYNKKPCTNCLHSYSPFNECRHFPKRLESSNSYIKFLKCLETRQSHITFHVQTEGYSKLIQEKFNQPGAVVIEKMLVPSFYEINHSGLYVEVYDLVFHANPLDAKGYKYFLSLSKLMPQSTFFVPNAEPKTDMRYKNVIFEQVIWGRGLQERLLASKIVLCPSFWSAPVEAAVIKSFLLGKPVALVRSDYGFANEIPEDCFIHLTGDIAADAERLGQLLNDTSELSRLSTNSLKWARSYIDVPGSF